MRYRLVTLSALAGLVAVAAVPGHAAPGPAPQVVDQQGDANFVNGQDEWSTLQDESAAVPAEPSQSTGPAEIAAADILSLKFATVKSPVTKVVKRKKVTVMVPTAVTATLTLAAPPSAGVYYWVRATSDGCSNQLLWFQYGGTTPSQTAPQPGVQSSVTCIGFLGIGQKNYTSTSKVDGNSITWTVPMTNGIDWSVGRSIKDLLAETKLWPMDTAMNSEAAALVDDASSSKSYVIGS